MSKTSVLLRPWSVRLIGNSLGSLFYRVSGRYRGVALRNLREAFGAEKTEREIETIAKNVFRHFARGAVEFFYLLSVKRDRIDKMIDVEGLEHIDQALKDGKGCIVITAHYGNWELLARKLVILGYKSSVIARDSDDPGMTGMATRIRESGGYQVFDKDQPLMGAFRALRRNELLGILPDQNELRGGIFVDFFSRPVSTATGPAVFALRSGAPLVPMFAPRMPDGRYKATAYPRIEFTPSGDDEKDIYDLTVLINQAIEREVRRTPDQWLGLHDRWKLTPMAPPQGEKPASTE
jgi:Kdo2-lipid IVA lauroyltransferase/acyltransferase